jgi:hypothetical protein
MPRHRFLERARADDRTPQARAAYAKVVAQRNDLERSHGRFVAVNGIRMRYLEWGDAKGLTLPTIREYTVISASPKLGMLTQRLSQQPG